MFEYMIFAFQSFREAIKERNLSQLFHQRVCFKRVAVPIVLDLSSLDQDHEPLQGLDYRFVELNLGDIRAGRWVFLANNRRIKAVSNFKKGYRGFALVRDTLVMADIWCVAPRNQNILTRHPDLDMLKITCRGGDAYALDMFISLDYRGKKLAVPLHRSLELILKREGWRRVYSYYWDDNIPSKWMHWMLKYNELPRLRVSRFFFLIRTHHTL